MFRSWGLFGARSLSIACLLFAIRVIAQGSQVGSSAANGETPLVDAARTGNVDAARMLIAAGVDLNLRSRGFGTALEAAERLNHHDVAALLRQAGARTFGRSVGDSVCVRPWSGDGFCGVVEAIDAHTYRIRITTIAGCSRGCDARPDCSAGTSVGGSAGLRAGDVVDAPSWCLTHTDVKP
jgi:ankyrin repeat protein